MSGYLLHQGATVQCQHAAPAMPVNPDVQVKVSGEMIVTQTCQYTVTGCLNPPPPPGPGTGPCVTCTWITAATRVKAGGVPVLLDDSKATCIAPVTGLTIIVTQKRVKGT